MPQYSLVVWTSKGLAVLDPLLLLGEGVNVVNLFTDDIESVLLALREEGCVIKEVNLIEVPPTTEGNYLIPGLDLGDA